MKYPLSEIVSYSMTASVPSTAWIGVVFGVHDDYGLQVFERRAGPLPTGWHCIHLKPRTHNDRWLGKLEYDYLQGVSRVAKFIVYLEKRGV